MSIRIPGLALLIALLLGLPGCARDDGSKILGHWRAERIKLMSLSIAIGPEFEITRHELVALDTDTRIPIESISQNGNEYVLNIPAGMGLSFYLEGNDRMYFDAPLLGKIYYQRILAKASLPTLAVPAVSSVPASSMTGPTASNSPVAASVVSVGDQGVVLVQKSPPNDEIPPSQSELRQQRDTLLAGTSAAESELASSKAASNELMKMAIAKMAQGKLDEAQKDLKEAQARAPKQPLVFYNMAILRMKQGKMDEALKEFESSFKAGFSHFDKMDQDSDLDGFRKNPRFLELVASYRSPGN